MSNKKLMILMIVCIFLVIGNCYFIIDYVAMRFFNTDIYGQKTIHTVEQAREVNSVQYSTAFGMDGGRAKEDQKNPPTFLGYASAGPYKYWETKTTGSNNTTYTKQGRYNVCIGANACEKMSQRGDSNNIYLGPFVDSDLPENYTLRIGSYSRVMNPNEVLVHELTKEEWATMYAAIKELLPEEAK